MSKESDGEAVRFTSERLGNLIAKKPTIGMLETFSNALEKYDEAVDNDIVRCYLICTSIREPAHDNDFPEPLTADLIALITDKDLHVFAQAYLHEILEVPILEDQQPVAQLAKYIRDQNQIISKSIRDSFLKLSESTSAIRALAEKLTIGSTVMKNWSLHHNKSLYENLGKLTSIPKSVSFTKPVGTNGEKKSEGRNKLFDVPNIDFSKLPESRTARATEQLSIQGDKLVEGMTLIVTQVSEMSDLIGKVSVTIQSESSLFQRLSQEMNIEVIKSTEAQAKKSSKYSQISIWLSAFALVIAIGFSGASYFSDLDDAASQARSSKAIVHALEEQTRLLKESNKLLNLQATAQMKASISSIDAVTNNEARNRLKLDKEPVAIELEKSKLKKTTNK